MGNLIEALAKIIDVGLNIYFWIIVARAVISWVNPDPYNSIVVFLYRVTEPVLAPIRRRLPMGMGIDFSPMVVILVILFLQVFLVKTILQMAYYFR
jgi:YggT family protein